MSKKQHTFRRVLTFVLAAVLALGFLSTLAFTVGAENGNINFDDLIAASRRGKCGENAIWTLDKNSVLTISGTGPMEMESSTAPWYKYKDEITAVVVGDGITSICDYAFMNLHYATSVSIGKDVQSIGEFAFNALLSLTSLTIPDNVKSIGSEAFGLCNSMTSVEIGDGVTFIDYWAFMNCDALQTVTVGAGWESFDADVFDMCPKLKSIVFDSANEAYTSVNGVVYSKDKTALVYIPSGITGEFVIPTTVTEIREGALGDTYGLDVLTIPASVKKIEQQSDGEMGSVEKIYYVGGAAAWDKVEKNNCEEFFDGKLEFRSNLAITTQPVTAVVASGKTVKVTIKATGDGLKYAWYHQQKGKTSFTKSKSLTSNYFSVKMASAWNGAKIRCIITDKYGNVVKSDVATIYMGNPAKITTQPKSIAVVVGKTASVTVKATGDGLTYTWYHKNAGAAKYSKSSTVTNTYKPKMTEAMDGRTVYCVVTDKYGTSVKSSVVTITKANPAKITTQPKSVVVESGSTAKVTIKATGDGLKYTWYYAKKGSSKFTKTSVTSASYSVKMSSSVNGRKVYCVVTDKYGNTAKSSTVTLSMGKFAKITTQPKSTVVIVGKTASISVKATGDGLTYTWYHKNAGAAKYSKSSITKATYSAKMTEAMDGRSVYCVVTDKYGNTAKSSVVTIKMANTAKITTQPKNVTAPSGSTAKVTVKATGDGLKYQWYYKNPGSASFKKYAAGTAATYSTKMSTGANGRQVYCVVTDKYGTSVKSSVVTLYMGNPVKITTQPKDVAAEEGVAVKVTVKATGDGLKYQWYYKNPGSASFKKYAAGTAATYSTKMSTGADGRQVYCVVTDKYGNTAKSSVATLTMEEPIYVDFTEGSWEYTGLFSEGEYDTFDFTFYNESEGLVSVNYWQVLSQAEINEYLEYGWSMEDFREIEGKYCVNFHGTWRDFTYTVKGNTVTLTVEWGEDGEGAGTLVLQVQKDKSLKIVSQKNFISDAALKVGTSLTWVDPTPKAVELDLSSGHWSCVTEPRNGTLNQYYMVASNENVAYLLVYGYTTDASKDADINEPIVIDGITYYNYGAEEHMMRYERSGNTFTMTGEQTNASLVVTLQEDYSMVLQSVSGVLNSEIMKAGDVFVFEAYPVYVQYITKHPENTFGDYGDVLTATVETEGEGLTYLWYVWNGEDWEATNQTTSTYTMTMSEATAGQIVRCRVTDAEGNSQDSWDATFDYIAPSSWGTFRYCKPTADKANLIVADFGVENKELHIKLWEPLVAGEEPKEGSDLGVDGIYYREPSEGWWKPVALSVEEGLVKISILEAEQEVAAIYLERTDFKAMRVVRTTGTINDIPGFVESFAEGDSFSWYN